MKEISVDDWASCISPGARVFIGSNAATPHGLVREFLSHYNQYRDIEIVHILTLGGAPWADAKYHDNIRCNALFLGPGSREAVCSGDADYTPCFLSEIPSLFLNGVLPLDVALIQVSPPDQSGYCSFGVSVDVVSAACRSARFVIAQFNKRMPRTFGQSFIHTSQIDYFYTCNEELPELVCEPPDDISMRIGECVATLVPDYATLQMGIGRIPDAVLRCLTRHKGLGVHTEMFSDGVMALVAQGVITNRHKKIYPGKIVTSFCIGSRQLYDFVDNNPHIEFLPTEIVNDPAIIAKNDNVVAINSAIQVDLTGQVVSDSVGRRFYSGIGGQVDFIRGSAMSKGGMPIIALPSAAKGGTVSRIVASISEGSGVVTSRGDVHYVVTEWGIATLRGRSIRERALALINIAHPKFRDQLLEQVRAHYWVPGYHLPQPGVVAELGSAVRKVQCGEDTYLLRPLHPADSRRLQEFFYSHSQETVLLRYAHAVSRMSTKDAYRLVNVDQSRDLALAIVEQHGPREVIHAVGRYYLSNDGESAEVAFIARESKRGQGMGSILMATLAEVARKRGLKTLEARVVPRNIAMISILEKWGFERKPDLDEDLHLYLLDLATAVDPGLPGER